MKLFKGKSEKGNNGNEQGGTSGGDQPSGSESKKLTTKRFIVGILCTVVLLWVVGVIIGFFDSSKSTYLARNEHITTGTTGVAGGHGQADGTAAQDSHGAAKKADSHAGSGDTHASAGQASHGGSAGHGSETAPAVKSHAPAATHDAPKSSQAASHGQTDHNTGASGEHGASKSSSVSHGQSAQQAQKPHTAPTGSADASKKEKIHGIETAMTHGTKPAVHKRAGVQFVEALIEPIRFELEDRWWGWRPNDIINLTDNVNNFQLGVLEVTRRGAVALAERLARTGSAAAFDQNLERAMNWFMVKAEAYWFPSPESKYKEGIDELQAYKERLERGEGTFFTRPDNLIPLLMSFEDLLGSCDENLAKVTEEDGTPVSFFKADDYFYYSKGVASALVTLLEAVHEDFHTTLETRRSTEILHHAIQSCHHAAEIDPWIVMESDLSSIFANHRANMAAPISHARFYMGLLIKALST